MTETKSLELPDEYITLVRAAELSGVSRITLQQQAARGRLRTIQPARDRPTTRRWLHEYLTSRGTVYRGGRTLPLPDSYVAPDDDPKATIQDPAPGSKE